MQGERDLKGFPFISSGLAGNVLTFSFIYSDLTRSENSDKPFVFYQRLCRYAFQSLKRLFASFRIESIAIVSTPHSSFLRIGPRLLTNEHSSAFKKYKSYPENNRLEKFDIIICPTIQPVQTTGKSCEIARKN